MSRRLLLGLSMAVFAVPGLIVRAQQPQGPGILRGTVIREDTSEPIRDVRIAVGPGAASLLVLESMVLANSNVGREGAEERLLQQTLSDIARGPGTAKAGLQFNAVTDSNGSFMIEGIPPGEYTVISQREGYFGAAQTGPAALAPPSIARGTAMIVSRQPASITLTMVPGAAVSGRVLGTNGMPASNMTAEVLRVGYPNGVRTLQVVNQRASDDRGDYRVFYLPPGDYYLAVTPRSTVAALRGAGGNAPSQEVEVRTYYPDATDAMNARPITLRPGDDLTGMNVQLQSLISSKVTGRVVSQLPANAAVPQAAANVIGQRDNIATITLLARDRGSFVDPRWSSGVTASLASPNDGSFEIPNVPPGTYVCTPAFRIPRAGGPPLSHLAGPQSIYVAAILPVSRSPSIRASM